MYGFSSVKRHNVVLLCSKILMSCIAIHVRGRVQAIRPGFYTRMGDAIIQATALIAAF